MALDKNPNEHERAEQRITEELQAGGFCVALSGGGHRATLATMGALMALVDRRLNKNVMQIASVSGGSITNGFVAQRCAFEQLGPGEFDHIASELFEIVTRRGVLTKGYLAALLCLPALVSTAVAAGLVVVALPVAVGVVLGLLLFLGMLMFVGKEIEWLLNRRYLRLTEGASRRSRAATLASLGSRKVDHMFCMTDLVLGLPVYLSGQNGGMMYRRLAAEKDDRGSTNAFAVYDFQTAEASDRTIAETVRASAGFPGIPPRRFRMPRDPKIPASIRAPTIAFLADGGLWNNLGTQAQREDGLLGTYAGRDSDGVLRPFARSPRWMPLLVVNGSAPLRPSHPGIHRVPGLAIFAALFATTRILTANTVVPRVDAMKASFLRRLWSGRRPDLWDPLDLVVDLSEVATTERRYGSYTWGESEIRGSDEGVKKWERDVLVRVRVAAEHASASDETDWVEYLLGPPEPQGSRRAAGLADFDEWNRLTESEAWQRATAHHRPGRLAVPTTLGRIDAELARRLVARGYLNTYLASMYLGSLHEEDLVYLERLPERLAGFTITDMPSNRGRHAART